MNTVIEIASIKRRFCAYLIDMAILLIPTLLIILLLKDFPLILHLSYIYELQLLHIFYIFSSLGNSRSVVNEHTYHKLRRF